MSADDVIYVQKNSAGKFVAQFRFMSTEHLPIPDEADPIMTFETPKNLIQMFQINADENEYGFRFINLNKEKENKMTNPIEFTSRPRKVEGKQVTEENMTEVAEWCGGHILTAKLKGQEITSDYIKVKAHRPLNEKQTRAYVTDWVLKSEMGFKVYTDKALQKNFDGPEMQEETSNIFDTHLVVAEILDEAQELDEDAIEALLGETSGPGSSHVFSKFLEEDEQE